MSYVTKTRFYWFVPQYGVNNCCVLCRVKTKRRVQKHTTKNFDKFHNHSPLLSMLKRRTNQQTLTWGQFRKKGWLTGAQTKKNTESRVREKSKARIIRANCRLPESFLFVSAEYMKVHIFEFPRKIWRHDWSPWAWTSVTSSQLAELVEHCTGITEVMGLNPVQTWIFFRL